MLFGTVPAILLMVDDYVLSRLLDKFKRPGNPKGVPKISCKKVEETVKRPESLNIFSGFAA